VETECDGVSNFLLIAYIRFTLHSPTEYINQPKLLVIITNIHVEETARRMKGNTGKYDEGGNIIKSNRRSIDGTFFFWPQYSLSVPVPCTRKNVNSPASIALDSFKLSINFARTILTLPCYAASGRRKRRQLLSPVVTLASVSSCYNNNIILILIIIIFINCNWAVTRWQWLFYMYTEYEIGY